MKTFLLTHHYSFLGNDQQSTYVIQSELDLSNVYEYQYPLPAIHDKLVKTLGIEFTDGDVLHVGEQKVHTIV